MAKPATTPRWADVGGAIVEPAAGKKDIGWIAEKPPHQTFNWWQNLVYQWIKWIDDGILTGISLALTGALTAASIAVSGALTAASMVLSGALTAATATITGAFTLQGAWYHPSRTKSLHFLSGADRPGFPCTRVALTHIIPIASGAQWQTPLEPETGQRILSASAAYHYDGSVDGGMIIRLINISSTGVATTIATGNPSFPGAPFTGPMTVTATVASPVNVSGKYVVEVEFNTGSTAIHYYGCSYSFDRVP